MTQTFRTLILGTALSLPLSPAFAEVTIRYLASHGGLNAHELAAELGYFDGTGITLENVGYAQGGPASLVALAGGSVELGSAATPAVLNAIAAGNDFVAAYPSNGINTEVQSVFYVLEDSPVRSVADLVGRSIAVNTLGAHLDYVVREALHQHDLPGDAANLIVVPGPQLEQVLRSGQVDVSAFGYWQTTFTGAALQTGGLRPIFGDAEVLGEIAGGFVVLRQDWIDAHPDEARIFVEAATRALDFAREHPAETREIFARALAERGENPDIAQYFAGFGVREGGRPPSATCSSGSTCWSARAGCNPVSWTRAACCSRPGTARRWNGGRAMTAVEHRRRGEVSVRDLSKSFALNGQRLEVLRKLGLEIRGGEALAIVGPSGCGKTTLLRILAGLEVPDQGEVRIDGQRVSGVGTERAIIFQEPRLLPWLSVVGNVAFGLGVRGTPAPEAERRARHYLRLVGLSGYEEAYPRQLSGGMAQRVGIARALTVQPGILLLDEPLGALDAMTKITLQEELARIWRDERVTMVLVTHDLEEAIYLADRVLVLPGQKGAAPQLIDVDLPRPRDRNEAGFVALRRRLMGKFGLH